MNALDLAEHRGPPLDASRIPASGPGHRRNRLRRPAAAPAPALGFALALALVLALAPPGRSQGADWIRAHYRKTETLVPMRDGVRLFTAVYAPRAPGPHPILLHRTCYGIGPYGPDAYPEQLGPGAAVARDGYIFVYQDVRGKMMSGGSFREMTPLTDGRGVDEASDAWDTIAWALRSLPGHNGRVGAWGISYPGFYAACTLVGSHPALRAVSPQAPMADLFAGDDDHHNGALFLAQTFWYDAQFGFPRARPTPVEPRAPFAPDGRDAYRFFLDLGALPHVDERWFHGQVAVWRDEAAHGSADGYWRARDLRPHLRAIRPAVLTVGGWYDAEDLFGTLQVARRVAAAAPGRSTLVMGPWAHGGWAWEEGEGLGGAGFGSATSAFFRDRVEAPFFRHHLAGGPDPALPRALVFETGANRWRRFDAWPPRTVRATPLYFREGGRLSFQPPGAGTGADTFVSDPARPVPHTAAREPLVAPDFMVEDQRFAADRDDVRVYRTDPLRSPLTLAGPVRARLQVAIDGTDADWVVKLVDEFPADGGPESGLQRLVRAEVRRGKFRRSLSRPVPFVPGRPEAVAFTLNDVCHTFAPGHRIQVQVQGSWFPLVDRNPGVFLDIYRARDEDFRPVAQTLLRSAGHASRLVLPVLP